MSVPQTRLLSLNEAANYTADRCAVSLEDAKAALDRSFREYSLGVFSDRFEKVQGWGGVRIDWQNSAVVGGEYLTINGVPYALKVSVFRKHLDKWIGRSARAAARHLTISLGAASERVGEARFGADWVGKLAERERWLIKRYIEPQHDAASSLLSGSITYVGPGGPIVPVNDWTLRAEVEKARDRLDQMNDQYAQVYDWLEDRGFDVDSAQLELAQFEHAFAEVFSPAAMPERAATRLISGTDRETIGRIGRAPEGGTMAVSNRAPDWGWWSHVPTVTLHEAVALSLNINPKQLRRAGTRALMAGRQFDEGPEFERRLALANRCLGDTLRGPVNQLAVHYYDEAAAVRLREFAAWAHSVEWRVPPELARLAGGVQSGDAPILDPQEHVTTLSVLAGAEIEPGRATPDAYTHSGFSGRPSKGKHLIDDEFDRRAGAGTALPSLADEAKLLFDWFKQQHPTLARPTTKTIRENIRARHREWKAGRHDPATN